MIYRVSSLRDVVFRRELEQIAAQRGARLWFVAGSRAELGGDPLSGGELTRRDPRPAPSTTCTCAGRRD